MEWTGVHRGREGGVPRSRAPLGGPSPGAPAVAWAAAAGPRRCRWRCPGGAARHARGSSRPRQCRPPAAASAVGRLQQWCHTIHSHSTFDYRATLIRVVCSEHRTSHARVYRNRVVRPKPTMRGTRRCTGLSAWGRAFRQRLESNRTVRLSVMRLMRQRRRAPSSLAVGLCGGVTWRLAAAAEVSAAHASCSAPFTSSTSIAPASDFTAASSDLTAGAPSEAASVAPCRTGRGPASPSPGWLSATRSAELAAVEATAALASAVLPSCARASVPAGGVRRYSRMPTAPRQPASGLRTRDDVGRRRSERHNLRRRAQR